MRYEVSGRIACNIRQMSLCQFINVAAIYKTA